MKAGTWRRLWLAASSANGAIGMCGAAMAAHSLPTGPAGLIDIAVRYQLPHAVALLAIAVWPGEGVWKKVAGGCFLAGTILFCGSLYMMALAGIGANPAIPVGGASFILGWVAIGVAAWRDPPREGGTA